MTADATQPDPAADWQIGRSGRRSLAIFATGAMIGLSMAGYSLFTARGTVIRGVPTEDVALVNQRPILVSDFNAQVEAEFGKPAMEAGTQARATVRDEMIREELFVQRGLELDMPSSDPATRAALVAAVEQQAQADAVSSQPDTAAYRRFYDAHPADFATEGTMTVIDYGTPVTGPAGQAIAAAGAAALRQHGQPAGLADTRRTKGEEFYFAARLHLGPALFTAARNMAAGTVSDPIWQADGWHVLAMAANIAPKLQSFDTALPQVMTRYRQDAAQRSLANELRYLGETANIQIAKSYR